jgi:xanthine dehydrogenase YagS FAD-binding subunit
MNNFRYTRANDLDDAVQKFREQDNPAFVAGGTNLLDLMKENISRPDTLIDINHIEGYGDIKEQEDGGILMGALVTNAVTAYHPIVAQRFSLLSKAILAGASAQIRNMATNGGNLLQRTRCYYFYDTALPCNKRAPGSGCAAIEGYNRIHAILGASEHCIATYPGDMSVALAALEAVVIVTGDNGERHIPLEDFYRLPEDSPHIDNTLETGEIITGIRIPPNRFANTNAYTKIRDRSSFAFALVSVATAFEMSDDRIVKARIALGGVAHKPWRRQNAEDFLTGKAASYENFSIAASMIVEGASGYKFNSFKIPLARKAIIRNCLKAAKMEE